MTTSSIVSSLCLLWAFHKPPCDCITNCWAQRLSVCQLWGGIHVSSQSTNPLRSNMFIWTLIKVSMSTLLSCSGSCKDSDRWYRCHQSFFLAALIFLDLETQSSLLLVEQRTNALGPGASNSTKSGTRETFCVNMDEMSSASTWIWNKQRLILDK